MRPRSLPIMRRCLEDGIAYGWQRAHKHVDKPSPHDIRDAIENAVMDEIHTYFEFEEGACSSNE